MSNVHGNVFLRKQNRFISATSKIGNSYATNENSSQLTYISRIPGNFNYKMFMIIILFIKLWSFFKIVSALYLYRNI